MHTKGTAILLGLFLAGQPSTLIADDIIPASPIDQITQTCPTPQALAAFLHRTFQFESDQEQFGEVDRWQSPSEFVQRKRGDCEDYAVLAQAVLARRGVEAYVFSVIGTGGYAHTVCVFVDERGRYNVLNQDRLSYPRARSLEAVASYLYPAWTVAGIATPVGVRGRFVKKFVNARGAPAAEPLPAPSAARQAGVAP